MRRSVDKGARGRIRILWIVISSGNRVRRNVGGVRGCRTGRLSAVHRLGCVEMGRRVILDRSVHHERDWSA